MKRALLLCCALGLLACSRSGQAGRAAAERCTEQDAGTPVDPLLLAFLSRARSAHHAADNLETNGDLSGAAAPLAGLVAGPFPRGSGTELAPEVREVLADTLARLADFHSRLGAFDQALADVKAGLENAGGPSYFQGHLLETQGLVEERRAKSLETSDPKAAAAARQRAIGLLEAAMAVQSSVIEHGTEKPTGSGIPAASALPAPEQP
jgi:hypothetical protein